MDDITGIANGDIIGVQTDSTDIHWTTVNGAPSGSTINLTVALDDDCAVDNNVYTYTTAWTQKVMQITNAYLRADDLTDTPLTILSREEYSSLADKTQSGSVLQIYPNPQLSNMLIDVWQVPDYTETDEVMILKVSRILEDFDAATDEPDFPQEWFQALAFNLAKYVMPKYGCPPDQKSLILGLAQETLDDVLAWDSEMCSMFMVPADQ